jgi:ribonuclease HI
MAALKLARDPGARSLTVRTDSQVLLEQLGPAHGQAGAAHRPAQPSVRGRLRTDAGL